MKSLLRWFLSWWVRAEVRPEGAIERIGAATAAPVCYVLERRSVVDAALLESICKRRGLPSPAGR